MVNLGGLCFFRRVSRIDERLLRNFQLFLAIRTNTAHETLRANQVHRRGHEKRLDTHVHQTADGRRRVVGVQRREHQVSREGGLDPDFRRFKIANLADQNDVGILAQESSERGGKVQANLLLHLYLVDASQLEFDRVFRGHDVGVNGVQRCNGGIQRVRLARTGWTGYQHHAVGFQDVAFEFLQRLWFKPKLGHVQPQVFFVQQPHDDLFAVERGDGRNAEVQFLFLAIGLVLNHDAAVLRQAFFRVVQFGHDLQAAGDRVLQAQGRSHYRGKLPVNAEPYAHLKLIRLDMDIAGSTLDRVRQDQVHKLDDGSFFRRFFQSGKVHL